MSGAERSMTGKKESEGREPEDGLRASRNPAEICCRTEEPAPRKDGDIFFALTGLENQDMHLKDAESGIVHAGEGKGGAFLRWIYNKESLRRRGR